MTDPRGKWMPAEPTEEMIDAAWNERVVNWRRLVETASNEDVAAIYRAMYAAFASPAPDSGWRPNHAEVQSGLDRVKWAEGLICQLPADHDGRNSWLLNYGTSQEAVEKREKRGLKWDDGTRSAALAKAPPAAAPPPPDAGLTERERTAIGYLLNLAAETYEALDNSETQENGNVVIDAHWFGPLCKALDELESLPDDQPGYTMGPSAKAEWSLRRLLTSMAETKPESIVGLIAELREDARDLAEAHKDRGIHNRIPLETILAWRAADALAEATAVIEPFAKAALVHDRHVPGGMDDSIRLSQLPESGLTLGTIRAARAWLQKWGRS